MEEKNLSQLTIEELLDKIESCLAQPPADHIGELIRKGKNEEALKVLLKETGHWLDQENAQRTIGFLVKEMGPKTPEELIRLFKTKPKKYFTRKELKQMLTWALTELEKHEKHPTGN